MKKLNNQTGSAHVIIIIILIAAVLGLLGFVFWQNFVTKPAAKQAGASQITAQTQTDKTLVISEWAVKGNLGQSLATKYVINNDRLQLTTDEVNCGLGNGTGHIARLNGTDKAPYAFDDRTAAGVYDSTLETNAHIGNYYYFFVAATGVCEVNGVDQSAVAKTLNTATLSLIKTLAQD